MRAVIDTNILIDYLAGVEAARACECRIRLPAATSLDLKPSSSVSTDAPAATLEVRARSARLPSRDAPAPMFRPMRRPARCAVLVRRPPGRHADGNGLYGFRSSFRDWAAEETDHPRTPGRSPRVRSVDAGAAGRWITEEQFGHADRGTPRRFDPGRRT